MRRYFESLPPADVSAIHSVPDGIFLVRVDRAQYRWHKQKPYYEIRFAVLKPRHLTGCFMTGRLYCTPRAMWKLSWFLREFGYDAELLGRNEIDEKALVDGQNDDRVCGALDACDRLDDPRRPFGEEEPPPDGPGRKRRAAAGVDPLRRSLAVRRVSAARDRDLPEAAQGRVARRIASADLRTSASVVLQLLTEMRISVRPR